MTATFRNELYAEELLPPSTGGNIIKFRPCLSTYLILDGMPALLTACYIALCLHGFDAWNMVLLLSVILAFVHIWIRSHLLILSDWDVRYRTLLRTKRIAFVDVKDFAFEVGSEGYWRDGMQCHGAVRLVIRPHRDTHIDPLVINAKLFSLRDIQTVCSILRESKAVKKGAREKGEGNNRGTQQSGDTNRY
jgi:hypothetical protein